MRSIRCEVTLLVALDTLALPVKPTYGPEVFPHLLKIGIDRDQPFRVDVEGPKVKKDGTPSQTFATGSWPAWTSDAWPAWVKDEVEKLQDMIKAANGEVDA